MTDDCCHPKTISGRRTCPTDGTKGKPVESITLKSLLKPSALETLESDSTYHFCESSDCSVVYFNEQGRTFQTEQIKVPIFQKHHQGDVPVCYCFHWTRQRIIDFAASRNPEEIIQVITTHVQAHRCGCEVNNPQGQCCLGNVRQFVQSLN